MFLFWLLLLVPKALPPNFCVDCKHYMKNGNPEFGKCALFYTVEKNDYLVTGTNLPDVKEYRYCSTARSNTNMCGQNGKFYEKKPTFSYFSVSKDA